MKIIIMENEIELATKIPSKQKSKMIWFHKGIPQNIF